MWAVSRPISRIATGEYRPSGISTTVTGVNGWLARTGAAHKIATQNIKDGAQRTWFSVIVPSTKMLEITRLRGDYTRNSATVVRHQGAGSLHKRGAGHEQPVFSTSAHQARARSCTIARA